MAKERILVVEDDDAIHELITFNLERESYTVVSAKTGEEGLKAIATKPADLIVLDLMLPGIDGLEVCRRLKAGSSTSRIPIVMVTAKGEEADIVAGLELGADDYIAKPFRPRELVARVRAVLRRAHEAPRDSEETLRAHEIELNTGRREVKVRGKAVELSFSEFEILVLLMRRAGWVFTRYQIVDAVHGENYPVTDRSVDVQIVGLRKKLGAAGKHIETVRGVGYRFGDRQS